MSAQAMLGLASSKRADDQWATDLKEKVASLYGEMRSPLYRYLLCMRIAPEEAEEIMQESFLRLYKHLHAEGDEGNLLDVRLIAKQGTTKKTKTVATSQSCKD